MYITVRFGEGQEAIFNPNCRTVALLHSIRNRCLKPSQQERNQQRVDIELSDESGNVKYLRDKPFSYANEILSARERLILLRVDKSEGARASYTPLLKDEKAITEEFLARLSIGKDAGSTERGPERRPRAKSNTRRTPTDNVKDKDGRKSKADQRSAARPAKGDNQNSRS